MQEILNKLYKNSYNIDELATTCALYHSGTESAMYAFYMNNLNNFSDIVLIDKLRDEASLLILQIKSDKAIELRDHFVERFMNLKNFAEHCLYIYEFTEECRDLIVSAKDLNITGEDLKEIIDCVIKEQV